MEKNFFTIWQVCSITAFCIRLIILLLKTILLRKISSFLDSMLSTEMTMGRIQIFKNSENLLISMVKFWYLSIFCLLERIALDDKETAMSKINHLF